MFKYKTSADVLVEEKLLAPIIYLMDNIQTHLVFALLVLCSPDVVPPIVSNPCHTGPYGICGNTTWSFHPLILIVIYHNLWYASKNPLIMETNSAGTAMGFHQVSGLMKFHTVPLHVISSIGLHRHAFLL